MSKCFSQVFARGDTVAPSGLYARLCHAFLVFFKLQLLSYLCGGILYVRVTKWLTLMCHL